MTTNQQILGEKLQDNINKDIAKMSALSLCKIDKYKYFTRKEILPSGSSQVIEQAKFICSALGRNRKNRQN